MNPQAIINQVPRRSRCSSCMLPGHNRRSCDVWRNQQARLNALAQPQAEAQAQAEVLARNQADAAAVAATEINRLRNRLHNIEAERMRYQNQIDRLQAPTRREVNPNLLDAFIQRYNWEQDRDRLEQPDLPQPPNYALTLNRFPTPVEPQLEPRGRLQTRLRNADDMRPLRRAHLMVTAGLNPHPNNAIVQETASQVQSAFHTFHNEITLRNGSNFHTSTSIHQFIDILNGIAADIDMAETIAARRRVPRNTTKNFIKNIKIVRAVDEDQEEEHICTICLEELEKSHVIHTNCNHSYCLECVSSYSNSIKDKTCKPNCPMCRGELNEFNTHSDEIHTQLTTFIEAL